MSNEQFNAEIHWFHIFKEMVDSGDIAKMGPYALMTYVVVKSHANLHDGESYPSQETIAKKAGISLTMVNRGIKKLEEMGYLKKNRIGKSDHYQLREKINIKDNNDAGTVARASWDYVPKIFEQARKEIQNIMISGDFKSAKIVNIEKLQINIAIGGNVSAIDNRGTIGGNVSTADNSGYFFNVEEFEKLPDDMKKTLLSIKKKVGEI